MHECAQLSIYEAVKEERLDLDQANRRHRKFQGMAAIDMVARIHANTPTTNWDASSLG